MAREPTREVDELALEWVRLRSSGKTSAEVGAKYGVDQERVRVVTNRILNDDIKHSGFGVAAMYWKRTRGKKT